MTQDSLESAAAKLADERLAALRTMDFRAAAALPWASIEDVVLAGRELQLAVYQQSGLPEAPEALLVTVQLLRAGLGGTVNFRLERGLVFTPDDEIRDATDTELEASR